MIIAGRICVSTQLQGATVGTSSAEETDGDLQSGFSGEIQPDERSLATLVSTAALLNPSYNV